ncbi:MAG: TSUP family transporter [Gammaproteobacteria bacterium]
MFLDAAHHFIHLDLYHIVYLFVVGFIGGLVSGFIGSGGAFVLTPAMMSMGVPGVVAVASNICHKFPKALVGAIKRAKYGQVDLRLGLVLGASAEAGVLYGAHVQESIKHAFGNAGSNLYVSVAFVVVLAMVGGYVLYDAWKVYRAGRTDEPEHVSRLACWVQSVEIPYTMMYFKSLNARISVLFTIPLGFATGMLAATIAVGGFIGVPGMHYVLGAPSLMASATELVVAFIMGLGGTIKYAWSGLVDVRLAMVILAGSLFGVQLGAIGTTYVRPHMIKVVMGSLMVLVLISRALVLPVYLSDLEAIDGLTPDTASLLNRASFVIMLGALVAGAVIILSALFRGMRARVQAVPVGAAAPQPASVAIPAHQQLSPIGRFERFLVATDASEYSGGALREALHMAQKCGARLYVLSVVARDAEYEALGEQMLKRELDAAAAHLDHVQAQAQAAGLACETRLIQGNEIHQEIANEAERVQADVIIMGRRGRHGLARRLLGDTTVKVIGTAKCSVLVAPRIADITGRHFLLASDGSRYADGAAVAAVNLAKLCHTPVTVVSVTRPGHSDERKREANQVVRRAVAHLQKEGIEATGAVPHGLPDVEIVEAARRINADLIIMGSHGRTGLERILLGSTSERVINDAPCAILIVKAG